MKQLLIPALAIASIAGEPIAALAIGINTNSAVGVNTDVVTQTRGTVDHTVGAAGNRVNSTVDATVRDGERRNAHNHRDNSTADINLNSTTGVENPAGKGLDVKANSAANINNPVINSNPVNGAIGLGVGANAR